LLQNVIWRVWVAFRRLLERTASEKAGGSGEVVGIETCVDLDGRLLRTGIHTLSEEGKLRDCTGLCTDPLHLALTERYCSLRGGSMDVVEEKDKRFIIRNL
jgi:hypothetical protein